MILYTKNNQKSQGGYRPHLLTNGTMKEVELFHQGLQGNAQTDLVELKNLATYLGIDSLYIKDESTRLGLNSFKILGAAYAIGKALSEKLDVNLSDVTFDVLKAMVKQKLSDIKLAATTDGNHGRGVAWMGRELGLDVVIYMPKGTTENRLNHIIELGAEAYITELNYDDTVRYVADLGNENGWLVIQDTAWEGYEQIPVWIMQGYSTIAREVMTQLKGRRPTHLFLQAGVGAFAGIIAEAFFYLYDDHTDELVGIECKKSMPKIVIVEAEAANCYFQEALHGVQKSVTGEINTIMAGLACGEANPIGHKILFQLAEGFISAPDWTAANGMRILGNPLKGDRMVISGESGAVSIGIIERILIDPQYKEIKEQLEINHNSVLLTFSTEGDTDRTVYRDIVWYGSHSQQIKEVQR